MNWVFRTLFCALLTINTALIRPAGAAGVTQRYSAPPGSGQWRGQVEVIPNATNYWLTATGVMSNNDARQTIKSVAQVQADGAVSWGVSATQEVTGQLSFRPVLDQPLVFAKLEGLPGEDFWTVFGLFNPRDGTRVFERGVPVILDATEPGPYHLPDPIPTVDSLADGRSTVLLESPTGTLHLAVLDRAGEPLWEKALTASSFTMAGRGRRSTLIENPGKGLWLLVQGSKAISTDPNPPPINTSVTLNLVRLGDEGQVLWTSKLAGLLTASLALSVGPAAFASDDTLVLPLTDTVINTWGTPTLLDLVTYLVAIGPDGNLRWAHRISGVTLATPVVASGSVYVVGQKLRSLSGVAADNFIMRLSLDTGNLMGQTSVRSTSALYLSSGGFSQGQLFVRATTPQNKALIGAFNASLSSAVFKQFDPISVSVATLTSNPKTGTLLFSAMAGGGDGIEAFTLDADLELLIPLACRSFSDVSIPMVNPELRLETVVLTPSFMSLSTVDTDLPLIPSTRLALQPIRPQQEDVCPPAGTTLANLALVAESKGPSLTLSFSSEPGRTYELLFTTRLQQPFQTLERLEGNGGKIVRILNVHTNQNAFFTVRTDAP